MEQKFSVAKRLEGCERGTKLYSPLFDESKEFNCWLELQDTTESRIRLYPLDPEKSWNVTLANDGSYSAHGECLVFPSKTVRDWNLFQVQYVKMTGEKETDDKLKKLLEIEHPVLNRQEYLPDTILYRGRIDNEVYCNRANDEEYNFILSTGTELKLEEGNFYPK